MEWKYCRDEKPPLWNDTEESQIVLLAIASGEEGEFEDKVWTSYLLGMYKIGEGWYAYRETDKGGTELLPCTPVFWMLPSDPFQEREGFEVDYFVGKYKTPYLLCDDCGGSEAEDERYSCICYADLVPGVD